MPARSITRVGLGRNGVPPPGASAPTPAPVSPSPPGSANATPTPSLYLTQTATAGKAKATIQYQRSPQPAPSGLYQYTPVAVKSSTPAYTQVNTTGNGFTTTGQNVTSITLAKGRLVSTTAFTGNVTYNGTVLGSYTAGIFKPAVSAVSVPVRQNYAGRMQTLGTLTYSVVTSNNAPSLSFKSFTPAQVIGAGSYQVFSGNKSYTIGYNFLETTSYNPNTGAISISPSGSTFGEAPVNLFLKPQLAPTQFKGYSLAYNVSVSPLTSPQVNYVGIAPGGGKMIVPLSYGIVTPKGITEVSTSGGTLTFGLSKSSALQQSAVPTFFQSKPNQFLFTGGTIAMPATQPKSYPNYITSGIAPPPTAPSLYSGVAVALPSPEAINNLKNTRTTTNTLSQTPLPVVRSLIVGNNGLVAVQGPSIFYSTGGKGNTQNIVEKQFYSVYNASIVGPQTPSVSTITTTSTANIANFQLKGYLFSQNILGNKPASLLGQGEQFVVGAAASVGNIGYNLYSPKSTPTARAEALAEVGVLALPSLGAPALAGASLGSEVAFGSVSGAGENLFFYNIQGARPTIRGEVESAAIGFGFGAAASAGGYALLGGRPYDIKQVTYTGAMGEPTPEAIGLSVKGEAGVFEGEGTRYAFTSGTSYRQGLLGRQFVAITTGETDVVARLNEEGDTEAVGITTRADPTRIFKKSITGNFKLVREAPTGTPTTLVKATEPFAAGEAEASHFIFASGEGSGTALAAGAEVKSFTAYGKGITLQGTNNFGDMVRVSTGEAVVKDLGTMKFISVEKPDTYAVGAVAGAEPKALLKPMTFAKVPYMEPPPAAPAIALGGSVGYPTGFGEGTPSPSTYTTRGGLLQVMRFRPTLETEKYGVMGTTKPGTATGTGNGLKGKIGGTITKPHPIHSDITRTFPITIPGTFTPPGLKPDIISDKGKISTSRTIQNFKFTGTTTPKQTPVFNTFGITKSNTLFKSTQQNKPAQKQSHKQKQTQKQGPPTGPNIIISLSNPTRGAPFRKVLETPTHSPTPKPTPKPLPKPNFGYVSDLSHAELGISTSAKNVKFFQALGLSRPLIRRKK